MTVEEVIQLGQVAASVNNFTFKHWLVYLFVAIVVTGICLYLIDKYIDEYSSMNSFLGHLSVLLFFIIAVFMPMLEQHEDGVERRAAIDKWKQDVAYPYINSLPIEKREIVYIKIDPELSHDVRGSLFYTCSTPVKLTPMTISFKGQGIETITDWYETYMELTDEEAPYIEFNQLDQNLGSGLNAGMYNKKVYLPESYKFTDIK